MQLRTRLKQSREATAMHDTLKNGWRTDAILRQRCVNLLGYVLFAVCSGCTVKAGPPPSVDSPYLLRLTGSGMAWNVQHPGPDGRLDTSDDILSEKDIHLPAGRSVKILLTSRDLLYTLAIQRHKIHEIAVPELEFTLELPADRPGEYRFQGDQMCGFQHDILFGRVVVHDDADFARWLKQQLP